MKNSIPAAMMAIVLCLALPACGAANAEKPAPDAAQAIKAESAESPASASASATSIPLVAGETTMDQLTAFFDSKSWKYEVSKASDGTEMLRTGFSVHNSLENIPVIIRLLSDGIKITGVSKFNANANVRAAVADYLCRANFGLIQGNFELDMRDGEVRYKIFLPKYEGQPIPDSAIDDALSTMLSMYHRYGDGLTALMAGTSTPEDEIKKAEGDL